MPEESKGEMPVESKEEVLSEVNDKKTAVSVCGDSSRNFGEKERPYFRASARTYNASSE